MTGSWKLARRLRLIKLRREIFNYRRFLLPPLFQVRPSRTTRSMLTQSIYQESLLDYKYSDDELDADLDMRGTPCLPARSCSVSAEHEGPTKPNRRIPGGRILEHPSLYVDCESTTMTPGSSCAPSPSSMSGSTTLQVSVHSAGFKVIEVSSGLRVPPWHYAARQRPVFTSEVTTKCSISEMSSIDAEGDDSDITSAHSSNIASDAGRWSVLEIDALGNDTQSFWF